MSEILSSAYARPRALNQNKYGHFVDKGKWPKYIWEFYPLAQDYYHEFNPYYVHLLYRDSLFEEFPVFTVRDGIYTFTDFLLKYVKEIPKWKTTFLVPPEYAPVIPKTLRSQFLAYTTSQITKPDMRKAKTVVVFALLCDQYFGSYEAIEKKLSVLRDLPKDVKLEVCLSQRRNVLSIEEKENLHYLLIPELIRKVVGNREIRWLRMRDLMEKTVLKDTYLLDLMDGKFMTCDSYLHYFYLSRGATVNLIPESEKTPSLFDLQVSLRQRLHVHELPQAEDAFSELLFFSKTTKIDLFTYPLFHDLVRKHVSFGPR